MASLFFTHLDECFNPMGKYSIVFRPVFMSFIPVPFLIQNESEAIHVFGTYFPSHFNLVSSGRKVGFDDQV